MGNAQEYVARSHYQSTDVAGDYDVERFSTWWGNVAHSTESNALLRALQSSCSAPGTVIDLPCGTARLFPTLLNFGLTVTGVDISQAMIDVAQKHFANNPRVSFQQADAEKLPFADNAFDYLTSFRLMCHLPAEARRKIISEMIRVTSKTLVINYHFASNAPLALFNKIFRPVSYPAYPVTTSDIEADIAGLPVKIEKIEKLSWYERSSATVILKKTVG